eukprot:SAG25_NODE_273_length_10590_cov_137.207968_10_plen_126_part_00
MAQLLDSGWCPTNERFSRAGHATFRQSSYRGNAVSISTVDVATARVVLHQPLSIHSCVGPVFDGKISLKQQLFQSYFKELDRGFLCCFGCLSRRIAVLAKASSVFETIHTLIERLAVVTLFSSVV